MVHVSNGEGQLKMLAFSPNNIPHQTQHQQQQSVTINHHHLNSIISTVLEHNSKEATVGDLLLPNNFQQQQHSDDVVPLFYKNNGLSLSCIVEEEPSLNTMTSTNIIRESNNEKNEQDGNANASINLNASGTASTTITTNSNVLNGNQNDPINNNNATSTTTTIVREERITRSNGHRSQEAATENIRTVTTTTKTTKKSSAGERKSSSSGKSQQAKKKPNGTSPEKVPGKVSQKQKEDELVNELVESSEECDKVPLLSSHNQAIVSGESSSVKGKSPVKGKDGESHNTSPQSKVSGESTTAAVASDSSNISNTNTAVTQPLLSTSATSGNTSSVKHTGKLTNGTKNPVLKRVSFGDSKGSMVETLIYESPVSDERDIIKTASTSPKAAAGSGGPSTSTGGVTTILKTTETNDSIDSTLSGGSTGGSRPASRVRVTFFESEKPLAVSSPESDTLDFDLSTNMTLPGSPITADSRTIPNYNRQMSGEIGWENPFRPDGNLSKEADQIVELIKEGKPINDETLRSKSPSVIEQPMNSTTYSFANASPGKGKNGTSNGLNNPTNEVQRGVVAQPNQGGQIEHVTLKKQKKGCCVVQ